MSFKIEEVQTDGSWVPLTDFRAHYTDENIFTLVVGQNAVGKSRLLRKIVSNYIFNADERVKLANRENYELDVDNQLYNNFQNSFYHIYDYTQQELDTKRLLLGKEYYDYFPDHEVRCSPDSAITPTNVIAVSTGRHDRFPSPLHSKKRKSNTNYNYIGTENKSGSNISNSLTALLEGLVTGRQKLNHLASIFEYLGFVPYLDIKLAIDKRQRSKTSRQGEHQEYLNIDPSLIDFLFSDEITHNKSRLGSSHIYEDLKYHSKANIELDFGDNYLGRAHSTILNLIPLLKSELIRISDVTLVNLLGKSRLRLSQASSGQQCMLTIMLGIAGAIQNGSLICIDEPEISLHPSWQSNIVSQLQRVFSDYHGCHFIIATHSPQIVAGLTSNNGYVLNLEERRLYHSHEYAKRSADFQLAEIFHAPGFNNEYLVRLTLLTLTKLSRREELSNEDRLNINRLLKSRELLSDTDPVFHLIGQVEALY